MFAVADHDNDGHIGFPEFMVMYDKRDSTLEKQIPRNIVFNKCPSYPTFPSMELK